MGEVWSVPHVRLLLPFPSSPPQPYLAWPSAKVRWRDDPRPLQPGNLSSDFDPFCNATACSPVLAWAWPFWGLRLALLLLSVLRFLTPLLLCPSPPTEILWDEPQPQRSFQNPPPTEKAEKGSQNGGVAIWAAQLRFKGSWLSLQSRPPQEDGTGHSRASSK